MVRALASHQCGLGSIPAQCHMWVEFVVGSHLAPRVFLGVLRFSFLLKNQHSELIRPENPHKKTVKANVASSINMVIYLFIYLFIYL